jgi:hypothetical protein
MLVLESPWDPKSVKSKSVWPFVSEFAGAIGIKAFHQTFSDKGSFCHWIARYNKEKLTDPKLLYVATHGSDGRISGLQRDINGITIRAALKRAKNIRFVHFGSCLYGTPDNLTQLLKEARHLLWAAGYNKSVDWVDSTLFDVLLWGRIAQRDKHTKGLKTHTLAKDCLEEVPGLSKNLGFCFQYRYGKKIESLIDGRS